MLSEPELVETAAIGSGRGVEHRLQRDRERVGTQRVGLLGQRYTAPPPPERVQHRLELGAPLGQLVDARARRRGQLAPPDQSGPLEVAQPLGEHVRADVRQPFTQVGEPLWPQQELADDQ